MIAGGTGITPLYFVLKKYFTIIKNFFLIY